MAAPYEEMGHQLKIYVGPPGGTAANQLTIATDVDYDLATQKGATTDRGTGGLPPITTENVTQRGVTITCSVNNDPDDAQLLSILAACIIGEGVAVVLKTGSNVTLFDGDCNIDKKYNAPLAGPGTYDLTFTPTKRYGRAPTLG